EVSYPTGRVMREEPMCHGAADETAGQVQAVAGLTKERRRLVEERERSLRVIGGAEDGSARGLALCDEVSAPDLPRQRKARLESPPSLRDVAAQCWYEGQVVERLGLGRAVADGSVEERSRLVGA